MNNTAKFGLNFANTQTANGSLVDYSLKRDEFIADMRFLWSCGIRSFRLSTSGFDPAQIANIKLVAADAKALGFHLNVRITRGENLTMALIQDYDDTVLEFAEWAASAGVDHLEIGNELELMRPNITITSSGTTATITTLKDDLWANGATIHIMYASEANYNGSFVVTKTGARTYTYTMAGTAASPATRLYSTAIRGADYQNIDIQNMIINLASRVKNETSFTGLVCYATAAGMDAPYTSQAEWRAIGKDNIGQLDKIGFNIYGGMSSHEFTKGVNFTYAYWGDKAYFSEWGIEGNATTFLAQPEQRLTAETYKIAKTIDKCKFNYYSYFFTWEFYQNQFASKLSSGKLRQMFFSLIGENHKIMDYEAQPKPRDMNNSLLFGGVNTYVNIGKKTFLQNTAWTFSTFVKPTFQRTVMPKIFSSGYNTGKGYGITIESPSNKFSPQVYYGGTGAGLSGTGPIFHSWNMLTVTFDGASKLKSYLNGKLNSEVTNPAIALLADGNVNTILGALASSQTNSPIKLTNTILSSREYSADEIYDYYLTGDKPSSPSLLLEYDYSEGSGATLNDISGNGNHGTIVNATWSTDIPFKLLQLASSAMAPATAGKKYLYNPGNRNAPFKLFPLDNSKIIMDGTSPYTFGVKVKLNKKGVTNNNDNQCLINAGLAYASNLGYAFYVGANDGTITALYGNSSSASPAASYTYGQWAWIIFTLSGNSLKAYVNKTKVLDMTKTRVGPGVTSIEPGYLAEGKTHNAGRHIDGLCDALFLSKTEMFQAQIDALVDSGVYPSCEILHTFDEGGGEYFIDSSGNRNDAYSYNPKWKTDGTVALVG